MTREQFEKVVAGLDETVGQNAVRQAREDGLSYEQFCQVLGTHTSGLSEVVLRRAYAAALMDEGVSGVTARQAQALHDALMADPELRWSFPQDGCHARGVLMVEAMLEMGVSSVDVGKFYAFHRDHAGGGGWQVTTLDGQLVHWAEHVAPTVLDRNGQPLVLDPATADAPRGVSAWTTGLGAPDFQHAPQTMNYAQIMLGWMNSGNVDQMLTGIQRLNPAAHHHLISEPVARDQLLQFGATLPPAPELSWMHLQQTQPKDSARFLKELSREYRTGAIIAVAYGQGPFLDVPFNTASPHGAGAPEARRYLASL
jgi:hypothetical protein